MTLLSALQSDQRVVAAELRPPRAELASSEGMDAWIDTYHSVTGLVRDNMPVFLTDSAVGAREEHNLRHLVINLGSDVPRDRVVPFLTSKHSLEFCLSYAEQAWQDGFPSLVVLGVVAWLGLLLAVDREVGRGGVGEAAVGRHRRERERDPGPPR